MAWRAMTRIISPFNLRYSGERIRKVRWFLRIDLPVSIARSRCVLNRPRNLISSILWRNDHRSVVFLSLGLFYFVQNIRNISRVLQNKTVEFLTTVGDKDENKYTIYSISSLLGCLESSCRCWKKIETQKI